MTDRAKVIRVLEESVPFLERIGYSGIGHAVHDALELLKPVKPIRLNHKQNYQMDNYRCGVCGNDMYYEQPFCEDCGTEAKWDDD